MYSIGSYFFIYLSNIAEMYFNIHPPLWVVKYISFFMAVENPSTNSLNFLWFVIVF